MNYGDFGDLRKEHEAFLAFLARAKAKAPSRDGLKLFSSLLEMHHEKEEDFLFPLLFGSGKGEGDARGPNCMPFFGPRVLGAGGWKDSYQGLSELLGNRFEAAGALSPFREKAFSSKSMIRIPVEDHILGARAMAGILEFPELYDEIFPNFAAMLGDHIQRENECLFLLFRRALSEEQISAYASAAAAFDDRRGTAALLARLAGS